MLYALLRESISQGSLPALPLKSFSRIFSKSCSFLRTAIPKLLETRDKSLFLNDHSLNFISRSCIRFPTPKQDQKIKKSIFTFVLQIFDFLTNFSHNQPAQSNHFANNDVQTRNQFNLSWMQTRQQLSINFISTQLLHEMVFQLKKLNWRAQS